MLLYTHGRCLEHAMQRRHPERPERLSELLAHFERTGLAGSLIHREAPAVDPNDVARVHTRPYLELLTELSPKDGLQQLDPDTALCPHTLEAAGRAAGAVTDAARAVLEGEDTRAFCAVRPPGHHAERDAGMGFCFYNSVAVAAAWALTQGGIERVAVLDFDVHHGNGTVEIFADDPRVLVCSSYQHPFYPNRMVNVVRDNIVHTPLPAGSDGSEFRQAVEATWFAKIERFAPQLIFISAGFDAHKADPLGGLALDESDYTWISREIAELAATAAEGRIVSTLEGGYDLNALALSAQAHVEALL